MRWKKGTNYDLVWLTIEIIWFFGILIDHVVPVVKNWKPGHFCKPWSRSFLTENSYFYHFRILPRWAHDAKTITFIVLMWLIKYISAQPLISIFTKVIRGIPLCFDIPLIFTENHTSSISESINPWRSNSAGPELVATCCCLFSSFRLVSGLLAVTATDGGGVFASPVGISGAAGDWPAHWCCGKSPPEMAGPIPVCSLYRDKKIYQRVKCIQPRDNDLDQLKMDVREFKNF